MTQNWINKTSTQGRSDAIDHPCCDERTTYAVAHEHVRVSAQLGAHSFAGLGVLTHTPRQVKWFRKMSARSRFGHGWFVPTAAGRETATTAGMLAARAWFRDRALSAPGLLRWNAEILLDIVDQPARDKFDERTDTRFRLEIYSEEWGFLFCHGGSASWIRVTDVPFVHGRDNFGLLAITPALRDIGQLLRSVEHRHGLQFRRRNALVTTNIPTAEPTIRRWVESL